MRRAHQRGRIAQIPKQLPPRFPRLRRAVIHPHPQFGIARLQRRMDHIAGNHRVRPRLTHLHREMIDRMPRRRQQPHEVAEHMVAFHDLLPLRRHDRQHGVGDPRRHGLILLLRLGPVRQLAIRKNIFRLRERGHPASVFQFRVPADMIDVQMGAHHVIDLIDRHARRGQISLELIRIHHVPKRPRRAGLMVADTAVDQDVMMRGLDQIALDAQNQLPVHAIQIAAIGHPALVFRQHLGR